MNPHGHTPLSGKVGDPGPYHSILPRRVLVGSTIRGHRIPLPIGPLYVPVRATGVFNAPSFRHQSRFFERTPQVETWLHPQSS